MTVRSGDEHQKGTATAAPAGLPEVGSMARDRTQDKVGRVMDRTVSGLLWLRPLGGGREWTARPEEVVPISTAEALRPHVAELNRQDRSTR